MSFPVSLSQDTELSLWCYGTTKVLLWIPKPWSTWTCCPLRLCYHPIKVFHKLYFEFKKTLINYDHLFHFLMTMFLVSFLVLWRMKKASYPKANTMRVGDHNPRMLELPSPLLSFSFLHFAVNHLNRNCHELSNLSLGLNHFCIDWHEEADKKLSHFSSLIWGMKFSLPM